MNPEKNQRTSEPAGPRLVATGEDAIGGALRSLPAEAAGPGFTARVLARLDDAGRASRPAILRPGLAWAALAAAALVAAVGIAMMRSAAAPPEAPVRIAESRPAGAPPAPAAEPEPGPVAAVDEPPPSAAGGADGDEAPPAATADTRLAAAGNRAAAGDAHDALARLRAELDALRREHRRFEIGLADLPEVGRDGQPVVYVGGDEGLGLVLDLGRDAAPGGRRDDIEPGASL